MKVLITVDESELAEKSFDWYFDQIHKEDNEVVVYSHSDQPELPAHIFNGIRILVAEEVERLKTEHQQKCLRLQRKYDEKCRRRAKVWKVIVETSHGLLGGHNAICRAEREKADIIVTGSNRLDKFHRGTLGSISDYIVQHATVPVMVCHF